MLLIMIGHQLVGCNFDELPYNGVPEKEIPRLANKAFNSINPGGFYIIHDFMVEKIEMVLI